MLKVKIIDIQKKAIVATGEPFLDVTAEFTIGEEVLTKKLGYPIDTPKEDIAEDLKKHLQTEKLDRQQRETNKVVEAQDAAAEETINSLQGEEIIAAEEETANAGDTKAKKSGTSKNNAKKGGAKR